MPRPPSTLLEVKLSCAPSVDNISAIQACETAAKQSGFCIVARTRRSVVLMPGPKRALFTCFAASTSSTKTPAAGRGITAELIADDEGDGLAISIAATQANRSRAFISALSAQLGRTNAEANNDPGTDEDATSTCSSHFKRENQAYYYYSRILYDIKSPPGLAASNFVNSFTSTYNVMTPAIDEKGRPMTECLAQVETLCQLVLEHASTVSTPTSIVSSELKPWLRSSVERCLFTRVGSLLWHLYRRQHSADDAQFARKARALEAVSDADLLASLEVRQEFRGSKESCSKLHALWKPKQLRLDADTIDPVTIDVSVESEPTRSTDADTEEIMSVEPSCCAVGAMIPSPYERAAAALLQIEIAFNSARGCAPREIIEALMLSQLEMKTCALEASQGNAELYSMDDIMPVFIFVLIRSSLTCPFACAHFMEDALNQDQRLDAEGQVVLLLRSAAQHVAHDWDISGLIAQDTSPLL